MTDRRGGMFSGSLSKRMMGIILAGSLLFITLLVGAILLLAKSNDSPVTPLPASGVDLFSATQAPTMPAAPSRSLTETAPASDENSISHVVQFGDTLSGIASLYEVDMDAIETANGLVAETIQPSQRITIPLTDGHQRLIHIVQYGQTVSSIASLYKVPPLLVEAANGITDPNSITAGQRLVIVRRPSDPAIELAMDALLAEISSRLGEIPPQSEWPRSLLLDGSAENYPLSIDGNGFTIHAQPGTLGESRSAEISSWIDEMLPEISAALTASGVPQIDIYIAGTPYAHPYMALRGTVDFDSYEIYFLHDGTGTAEEQRIFLATNLARLITRHSWGDSSSPLYDEGVAQMVGWQIAGDVIPGAQVEACNLLASADLLPPLEELLINPFYFASSIFDHPAFSAAGCFSAYVVETHGMSMLRDLHAGNYQPGTSFEALQSGWLESLTRSAGEGSSELANAYELYYQAKTAEALTYDQSETAYTAYFVLDRARTALWQGDLDSFNAWFADYVALTGFIPEMSE